MLRGQPRARAALHKTRAALTAATRQVCRVVTSALHDSVTSTHEEHTARSGAMSADDRQEVQS